MNKNIIIVYYIYINELSNWKAIIKGQLLDIKKFGLLKKSQLYIHITSTYPIEEVINFINTITQKAIISFSSINQYEYPAINLIYNLAKDNESTIFIYFHTKGMSYEINERLPKEKKLLYSTFKPWKKIIKKMNNSDLFNKSGFFISQNGVFIWYNFWYAKGKFLINLEKPKITNDRYYYESWLGKVNISNYTYNDTLSIYDSKFNKGLEPKEVSLILNKMIERDKRRYYLIKLFKYIKNIFNA